MSCMGQGEEDGAQKLFLYSSLMEHAGYFFQIQLHHSQVPTAEGHPLLLREHLTFVQFPVVNEEWSFTNTFLSES